jgi:hypothetical protein
MSDFRIRLRRRDITNEELLEDIRRVGAELGVDKVTRVAYDERGVFGATTVIRKFGKWNAAISLAGIAPANRLDITDEELFKNLAEIWTTLGRQPYGREMSENVSRGSFSTGTYEKRFGSWNKALIAFSDYISGSRVDVRSEDLSENIFKVGNMRRTNRNINWRLRAKILIRDSCICRMCGASPAKDDRTRLHVDHIVAWANGGETLEENLQTLCEVCNVGKSDMI